MANNNNSFKEPRINREITGYNEVRLIYKEYRDGQSENDFNKVVKSVKTKKKEYNDIKRNTIISKYFCS